MRNNMIIPVFDEEQLFNSIKTRQNLFFNEYYAFYSSWFGGIVKNPQLMLLPMDDHMVHRGDGVFEAMKSVSRSVYLLDEHLQRLFISAKKVAMQPPMALDQLKEAILETLRVANQSEATIRIFLSRGPGDFSVNPYDSIG